MSGKLRRWMENAPPRMVNKAKASSGQKVPKKATKDGFVFVSNK